MDCVSGKGDKGVERGVSQEKEGETV